MSLVPDAYSADISAITLSPDQTEIQAGAPVVIRGAASLPPGSRLEAPQLTGEGKAPFALLGVQIRPDGAIALRAAAFALGDQTFPALEWTVRDARGGARTLKSPPIQFKVGAPAAEVPGADIRDLRPPARPFPWPLPALALAALAALALWAWRRRRRAGPEPARRLLAPHAQALERLERLIASGLWETGAVKEFYLGLSDILRDYLEARYALSARTMTTGALLRQMRQLEIEPAVCREAKGFFEDCDLAKFARWKPEAFVKDHDIDRLRKLVDATAPRPSPSPLPAGGERDEGRGDR